MINFSSKITQRVLGYFLLNTEAELYLNEMVRKFDVDRGNLTRKLSEWEKEGIFQKRRHGNMSLYKINRKYPLLREMENIAKKSFGLEQELKNELGKIKGLTSVIIFGSYAKDKLGMESDIDLLLVGSHDFLETQKIIVKLQKKFDREINIIDMTEKEYAKEKKRELIKGIFSQKYIKII